MNSHWFLTSVAACSLFAAVAVAGDVQRTIRAKAQVQRTIRGTRCEVRFRLPRAMFRTGQ